MPHWDQYAPRHDRGTHVEDRAGNGAPLAHERTLSDVTTDERTFDAIVIGSGISGGWAAKELCEHGLKTLVLERGRDVQHIKDYPTANMAP